MDHPQSVEACLTKAKELAVAAEEVSEPILQRAFLIAAEAWLDSSQLVEGRAARSSKAWRTRSS